jgi:hypothetical protein
MPNQHKPPTRDNPPLWRDVQDLTPKIWKIARACSGTESVSGSEEGPALNHSDPPAPKHHPGVSRAASISSHLSADLADHLEPSRRWRTWVLGRGQFLTDAGRQQSRKLFQILFL